MNVSRPGPRDPRRPAESWAIHMVHGRAKVHGDEDGVGQVGEDDGESNRQLVRRAHANDSKASRIGGRSDTRRHWRFDQFGLKTGELDTSCGGVREGHKTGGEV